ncbi:MAG: type II toxin-antitoxin system VapC family toxin [Gemmatimonadota bacterium]
MVLDTSVVTCMLLGEPEAARMEAAVETDPVRLISAATVVEASTVLETPLGEAGVWAFDHWLNVMAAVTVDVTAEHAELARRAYRRFGKGRDVAGLNYGDCFAYAASVASGEPLLFKGGDFTRTDVAGVAY